jgi:putative ABC transport system permease protein
LIPAILRKSIRDLTSRKARTFFTVLTIAFGVMAMSLFGIKPLADSASKDEIERENLYNVHIQFSDTQLTESNLKDLEDIENVNKVEPLSIYGTKIYIGERRSAAVIFGIEDFNSQKVDRVLKTEGSYPGFMELMPDIGNSINGINDWKIGDSITAINYTGGEHTLTVSGFGKNLYASRETLFDNAVFYASVETVHALNDDTGYNTLSVDLDKMDDESLKQSVEDIRLYFNNTLGIGFGSTPQFRDDNEWPGNENLESIVQFLYFMILITIVSSRFLVSNTMHTIVSEQKKEIAQMKALGATNLQVFRSYFTTALLMGGLGSLVGIIFGVFLTHWVLLYIVRPWGFEPAFSIHLMSVIISTLVGIGVVIGSAMPALLGSMRQTVREGLESPGIASVYQKGALERMLMRTTGLPRTVQMGLRNVVRKKGRSAVTVLQVAMSVGLFLGLFAFGFSLANTITKHHDYLEWDMILWRQGKGPLFNENLTSELEMLEGVESSEPLFTMTAQLMDFEFRIFGTLHNSTMYDSESALRSGRWFNEDEEIQRARVIVLGRALADRAGLELGDSISVMHKNGFDEFKIIGIESTFEMRGTVGHAPITTVQNLTGHDGFALGLYIKTESGVHEDIDRMATLLENELDERGFISTSEVHYVRQERDQEQNRTTMFMFYYLILLVVFISMIGLLSTLTMNILDRTKEIGLMRCLGSSSRDIWAVFCSEGVILSMAGFIIGVPIGFFLADFIRDLVESVMKLHVELTFPLAYVFWAFVITFVGTLLLIQLPLWRATKIKPGDALRYQ